MTSTPIQDLQGDAERDPFSVSSFNHNRSTTLINGEIRLIILIYTRTPYALAVDDWSINLQRLI